MSYLSTFHIVSVGGATRKALVDAMADLFDDKAREQLDRWASIWAKWYEHETDIARAMLKCGAHEVVVVGIGENYPDDVWEKTFQTEAGVTVTVVQKPFVLSKPHATVRRIKAG